MSTFPTTHSHSARRARSTSAWRAPCASASLTWANSDTSSTSQPSRRLRLEKGYRDYGHDIDNTDNAFETGLGFFVDLNKPNFIGRDAALRQKAKGPLTRRLAQVLVKDPQPMLFHAEVLRRNGKAIGYVRAGSYGHTLGGAVGLAMIEAGIPINQAYLKDSRWEINIAGKAYPAEVSLRPLYAPDMARIKS